MAVDPIVVTLTTAGSATTVMEDGRLGLTANVTHTNMDVTWSLSGSACPASCGTVSRTGWGAADYAAPATVATAFTVTVTATSMEDTSKHDSVELTVNPRVCPANASVLDGQYAFIVQGFGPGGVAAIGSLTLDGCGAVTGGEADYFLGAGLEGSTTSLSGTYTIGTDRRGTLTVTSTGFSRTFAIAIGGIAGGVASRGSITDFSMTDNARLTGELWMQTPDDFEVSRIGGPYAFLLNGWTGTGPRQAMGGTVSADGSGHLGLGFVDEVAFRSAPTSRAWSGTLSAPSPSGRAVLVSTDLAGAGSAVAYVVDAGHLLAMVSDSSTGRVLSGPFLAQQGTFTQASLSGKGVAYQTANYPEPGYEALTVAILSLFTADGAGTLVLTAADENYGGNLFNPSGATYTYSVAANGQATIWTSPGVSGGKWYLTGPNTGLMLGFDVGMSVGGILPQAAGPFSTASMTGTWFVSQAPGASWASTNASGVATSPGTGALTTTLDVNSPGGLLAGVASTTTFDVASNGWAVDWSGHVIYVASPDRLFLMPMTSSDAAPVIRILER